MTRDSFLTVRCTRRPQCNKSTQATLLVLLLLCLCNPFKDRILNANTLFSARKRMQRYNKIQKQQNFSEKKSRKYENFFFHDKKGTEKTTLYILLYTRANGTGTFLNHELHELSEFSFKQNGTDWFKKHTSALPLRLAEKITN